MIAERHTAEARVCQLNIALDPVLAGRRSLGKWNYQGSIIGVVDG